MFNNNNKVDFIEQKILFFESMSKEVSQEFKRILEKLVDSNTQVTMLLSKQDLRINTLDINAQTISDELKDISAKIDAQNVKQDDNINELEKRIEVLYNFKTMVTWTTTGLVFITGILASSGWLTPDRIFSKPTTEIKK